MHQWHKLQPKAGGSLQECFQELADYSIFLRTHSVGTVVPQRGMCQPVLSAHLKHADTQGTAQRAPEGSFHKQYMLLSYEPAWKIPFY